MIAALYVETCGVYFGRSDVDPWDVTRDAKLYAGPHPVVAHPPCGPWSKLRHLCTKQDPECGLFAVAQVRAYGGVLEHPAHSMLFAHERMPKPGERDAFGGRTFALEQVSWGHPCRKPTWLYTVGIPVGSVLAGLRRGGAPTHCVCTGPRQSLRLPVASKPMKIRTPPAFADWLISLAHRAARTEAA